MTKKIFVILGVLVILGLLFSFLVYQAQKKEEMAKESVPGKIIAAHLEKAILLPETPGELQRTGIATTTFQAGDLISIQLEAEVKEKNILSFQIFTEKREKVNLFIPKIELSPEGRNYGTCCLRAPLVSGRYILKFFLIGKEVKTLNFEVIK